MKTSVLVLAAVATLSLSSFSVHAKDEMDMKSPKSTVQKVIAGKGTIISLDRANENVTLSPDAIPALGWGAMTMDFKVKDKMMLNKIKQGNKVEFTLVRLDSEYIISSLK